MTTSSYRPAKPNLQLSYDPSENCWRLFRDGEVVITGTRDECNAEADRILQGAVFTWKEKVR